tara:strand:+ start:856 stop:1260 length:405 start_codon:yes stop_codon:yes gene_type:complete
MASILRVNTLTDASSNNSTAMSTINQGTAKAWVNFNGQASGAASRDSFNVSGMTDNGTGDHTTSFSNAMANTNYVLLDGSVDNESSRGSHLQGTGNAYATSSFRSNYGVTITSGVGSTPADLSLNAQGFLGDLA